MKSKKKLIFVGFNEYIPELVKVYADKFNLNNLKELIRCQKSYSINSDYKNLEPWIQWNSIFFQSHHKIHKVFKFNQLAKISFNKSFFMDLTKKNVSIKSICGVNFKLSDDEYIDYFQTFVPDPWIDSKIKGIDESEFNIISKIVKNQSFSLKNYSLFTFYYFKRILFKENFSFFSYIFIKSIFMNELRSILLDIYLHSYLLSNIKRKNENNLEFNFIFFNSLAHLQHHFLFNSNYGLSEKKNPSWYINSKIDPFVDILKSYDRFLYSYKKLNYDLLVCNGLTQQKMETEKFYYRLKEATFLNFFSIFNIKIKEYRIYMSREFSLTFSNIDYLNKMMLILQSITVNNFRMFGDLKCELAKKTLYGSIVYPKFVDDIDFFIYDHKVIHIKKYLSFVAIKNSIHKPQFSIYTTNSVIRLKDNLKLEDIGKLISSYF